ncbi:putative kinesin [Leishmania braziliensis MHOM/BR/75/M2904]|uniref:Kinesin n=2 Tax=Leishmania braziliensis TaxID=5660 RepID=A4H6L3_LEIBR|nr:putative kinesin [Leishmania braziliensis MHOM/BR/75/M2904]CAJ2468148.1 unnamed protein product [Leishmania braziliensis]CAM41967.1 putative kinesin [Leishmania braziliensis MHOM/BR/75/M2904]SYZ63640.1 kinesin [Leishmania braziliensis MHOM/BR/75/M2904]
MSGSPSISSLPLSLAARDEVVIDEGVGIVVRVRPLSTKERADARVHNCIQCLPDCVIIGGSPPTRASRRAGAAVPTSQPTRATARPYQFSVDHVFNTHASQIEVYEQSCKRIVEGVFHGINGSILAYGATGSGKTHTMFGSTMSAAGIVYQAVQDIFAEKERLEEEEGKRVRIKCSFLEIYNEDVYDLLAKPTGENGGSAKSLANGGTGASGRESKRVPLQVREACGATASASAGFDACESDTNSNGGLHIHGLTHIFPETLEDFARSIEYGHAQRFVAATGANAQSSRSHAIITVEIEVRDGNTCATIGGCGFASSMTEEGDASETNMELSPSKRAAKKKKKPPGSTVTIAKIQFADLAGSERAAATSNTGLRLREGGNINRSLLALGAVVQSLAQQKVRRRQTGGKGGGKMFIPYRGSKLTRVLRSSIGGNCRTQILFCLNPSTKHTEEAVNTLKFAMNAREVQVEAYRNEFAINSSQLAKTQEALIEELREELTRAQSALAAYTGDVGGDDSYNSSGGEGSQSRLANTVLATEGGASSNGSPLMTPTTQQGSLPTTLDSPIVPLSSGDRDRSSPAPTPAVPAVPPCPNRNAQRGTITPSAATADDGASSLSMNASHTPMPVSGADMPRGSSVPHSSLNCRTARPSVFAENTPLFSELEAKLKNFSAQKESLYHEVREAQERQRDRETQLREQKWRLATFLVSNASGNQAREGVDGNCTTAVGVAGLRKMIAALEAEQAQQADELKVLTKRLDDADRQFAATRQDLLRERQGTSLELLLDNARLRQGCTEAECLAAHYHQECRSLLNRQAEYAEALSKCVEAIQCLCPYLAQLTSLTSSLHSSVNGNAIAAAVKRANVALLYALLPTTSTAQMMAVFEFTLRLTMQSPLLSPALLSVSALSHSPSQTPSFAHPPLAPSPTNRSGGGGSSSSSPLRGGGSSGTRSSNHLASHFRDLMATAESMHLTSSSEQETSDKTEGVRTRHGHLVLPTADSSSSPERCPSIQQASKGDGFRGRAPAAGTSGPSKAFRRTGSSTGLTRGTVSPPAGGQKRRSGPGPDKTSLSGLTGEHVLRSTNGVAGGAAPKKNLGGGAPSAHELQRSVTAPLQFGSVVSHSTKAARKPKAVGDSGSATSSLARRHAGTQRVALHRGPQRTPDGNPGGGDADAASPCAFVRSNTASALRANASALHSAGYNLRGRPNHRSGVSSSPPKPTQASAEATGHNGSSRSMPSRNGPAKKKQNSGSRTSGGRLTTSTSSSYPDVDGGQPRAPPHQERRCSGDGVESHLLTSASPSASKLRRSNTKTDKLTRFQATTAAGSPSRMARTAGASVQRRLDCAEATAESLTAAVIPSRILSSSSDSISQSVSCESGSSGYNRSLDGQIATSGAGTNGKKKAANGALSSPDSTPQLTMARLLECAAATAVPALPQYGAGCSPNTHSSDCANKENGQQLFQLRTRTSFTDDLMVSISTCLSDALSPTSRGQVSSSYC